MTRPVTKLIQDLANYDKKKKKLSNNQQVVASLNLPSDKYWKIRNAWKYRREDLTVDITLALRSRELELKTKFKNSKNGEGLYIKEKLNQSKKNDLCNYNSYKKGKSQNRRFKDKIGIKWNLITKSRHAIIKERQGT